MVAHKCALLIYVTLLSFHHRMTTLAFNIKYISHYKDCLMVNALWGGETSKTNFCLPETFQTSQQKVKLRDNLKLTLKKMDIIRPVGFDKKFAVLTNCHPDIEKLFSLCH